MIEKKRERRTLFSTLVPAQTINQKRESFMINVQSFPFFFFSSNSPDVFCLGPSLYLLLYSYNRQGISFTVGSFIFSCPPFFRMDGGTFVRSPNGCTDGLQQTNYCVSAAAACTGVCVLFSATRRDEKRDLLLSLIVLNLFRLIYSAHLEDRQTAKESRLFFFCLRILPTRPRPRRFHREKYFAAGADGSAAVG